MVKVKSTAAHQRRLGVTQLAFRASQGRYEDDFRFGAGPAIKSDVAPVWRPRRTVLVCGTGREPQRRAGANQLDIDIAAPRTPPSQTNATRLPSRDRAGSSSLPGNAVRGTALIG